MEMKQVSDAFVALVASWGVKIIGALIGLFAAFAVAGWVRRLVRRGLEARHFDETLTSFFANFARYAVLVAAILGLLGIFGVQTTSFAAVIAAAGLAVGLAFQGTLSNFAAGIMLLVFRPFKLGDVVIAGGTTGVVKGIDLFSTEFTTLDNRRIIVPNSKIFSDTIENLTYYPVRRVDIPVGVDYAADIDRTREVLETAIKKTQGVLSDPGPQVFLKSLGASSVDWSVRAWCKSEDYWLLWEALIREIKIALDEAKIGIPFPQMDVHLDRPSLEAISGRSAA